MKHIVLIEGHPDPAGTHLGNALATAYAEGAAEAGHKVSRIVVARLDFPLLRTAQDWKEGRPSELILGHQRTFAEADHLAIFYPLWMGDMPAVLKGYFEQVLRPTFGETTGTGAKFPKVLKGKSARIVVTMGMPGLFYRLIYRAHSLKSLERNILKFTGVSPVRSTIFGMIEAVKDGDRAGWMRTMRELGRKAS